MTIVQGPIAHFDQRLKCQVIFYDVDKIMPRHRFNGKKDTVLEGGTDIKHLV